MAPYRPTKTMLVMSGVGTVIGSMVFFKEFVGGNKYEGKEKLEGKTVIITGANSGIGKEVAREMANRGARVIMACRKLKRCEEARKSIILETKNREVHCRLCNLASMESIRQFAGRINSEESQVNILINNAGVMRCPRWLTKDGFELQLGVNHLGHFLLTNLLLEKLKLSGPSRIVNVSSVSHQRGAIDFADLNSDRSYDPVEAYNQSKLANVLFTKELASRLKGTQVSTFAVHPGVVNSNITRHMGISKSQFAGVFAKPLLWLFTKSARQGAQSVLYCALSPTLQNSSGKYYSNCKEVECALQAQDEAAATRLWLISEKWTRLK